MSGENYTNTATTATTAAPVGPSDTTASLASFTGWPAAPFWAEFEKDTASYEIVRVTNVAGSTITMTRGQGGTAATSHGAGVNVELVVPASHFNETETHMAATSAHGVTGNVVGTSGAQTVADKLFRGAAKSQNSDALPTGITASFENLADNSSARDGFVHRNTAGHVDRRGFLLEQSGTPRFQAFNDGSVDIAPGTSTRPGLRNHGTTTLDGATTHNAAVTVTAGGVNVAGGAVVSGGAIITGSLDLGPTTVDSLSSDATIHANGSIDTDANLIVDGTSTLTGAVAAGAGLTVATTLAVTQGITGWGSPVILSVSSTAAVTTPTAGMYVFDRSAGTFKQWDGSAWQTPFVAAIATPQATLGTTTSTTFTSTLTGATGCSVVFVAPPSGRVSVENTTNLENSGTSAAVCGFEIRTGSVIGSGTVVYAASDDDSLLSGGGGGVRATVVTPVTTGLTGGQTYHCRQMFRASASTATYLYRRLTVRPEW